MIFLNLDYFWCKYGDRQADVEAFRAAIRSGRPGAAVLLARELRHAVGRAARQWARTDRLVETLIKTRRI